LYDVPYDGFFGYTCYDAVKYFEKIDLKSELKNDIPLLQYHLFRYVLLFNHFNEQIFLFENRLTGEGNNLDFIEGLNKNKNFRAYPFSANGKIESNLSDKVFKENVTKGKQHCQRGDVFQVVMSRGFSQPFSGDDFNVYRSLRSINPSPYLFYFDFGSFRIFGSSPEAQLVIKGNKAYINPIAGTFRRTGNDERDRELAQKLLQDPKENAEHVMLVDLARNDLSVHCKNVTVEKYKDIHFYSHVIHLVSTVSGELIEPGKPFELFSKTFPAGTLSGAPKIRAMQIIDECERTSRGYYGGAIGIIGIDGSMNQAIMIRSFLSKDNTLHYQAGAGVVIDSSPDSELQEVNNKLGALKKAIEEANLIAV
jgi:anthranilate synthase component 1